MQNPNRTLLNIAYKMKYKLRLINDYDQRLIKGPLLQLDEDSIKEVEQAFIDVLGISWMPIFSQ